MNILDFIVMSLIFELYEKTETFQPKNGENGDIKNCPRKTETPLEKRRGGNPNSRAYNNKST